jgi:acyl-CoA thioester hydrolase
MTQTSSAAWPGHLHRVRYSEVDPQSIVFNSRYLEYFDAAMTEFYRAIGFSPQGIVEVGFDPVLMKVEIQYHSSAVIDDLLRIGVECSRIGNSSMDLDFTVKREVDSQLMATGKITYVNIDQVTRKSIAIPAEIRAALKS